MFQPPEAWLSKSSKGKPIDVWAIGVTFFYLAFGRYPFFTRDVKSFNRLVETTEPEYPEDADPDFVALL